VKEWGASILEKQGTKERYGQMNRMMPNTMLNNFTGLLLICLEIINAE